MEDAHLTHVLFRVRDLNFRRLDLERDDERYCKFKAAEVISPRSLWYKWLICARSTGCPVLARHLWRVPFSERMGSGTDATLRMCRRFTSTPAKRAAQLP
eukprot:5225001-Pleurochrysis_carterae.AAC.2